GEDHAEALAPRELSLDRAQALLRLERQVRVLLALQETQQQRLGLRVVGARQLLHGGAARLAVLRLALERGGALLEHPLDVPVGFARERLLDKRQHGGLRAA